MDASYKTIWFSLYYDNRQILLLIIVILYHIYSNILFTKYVKFLLCFNKINVIIYLTYAYSNKQKLLQFACFVKQITISLYQKPIKQIYDAAVTVSAFATFRASEYALRT